MGHETKTEIIRKNTNKKRSKARNETAFNGTKNEISKKIYNNKILQHMRRIQPVGVRVAKCSFSIGRGNVVVTAARLHAQILQGLATHRTSQFHPSFKLVKLQASLKH